MNSRQAWRLFLSQGRGDRWVSRPRGHFSPALRRGEARRRVIDA
uniref:Coiled-coil domain containing 90B n=1 Tax=Homo sapiens TaxID=9606 RepID=E9PSG6_HUMAN